MMEDNFCVFGYVSRWWYAGPVVEDYVTIGAGASLLPGVVVGRNAIIGASALVTKNVPAGKVVMGVPARVIRDI